MSLSNTLRDKTLQQITESLIGSQSEDDLEVQARVSLSGQGEPKPHFIAGPPVNTRAWTGPWVGDHKPKHLDAQGLELSISTVPLVEGNLEP